jgi:hypothetical protein
VADAFYVSDRLAGGGKLGSGERSREVEQALHAALAEPDPQREAQAP